MLKMFELGEPLAPVAPDTPGETVLRRFEAEPDTLAIAVVDATGRPIGLIERHSFSLRMASHYGRALYAVRPVSMVMDAPLLVDAGTDISDFTGATLLSRRSDLLKGFIVCNGGRYAGVGSALALLQAANAINQHQAEAMTQLASQLTQARDAANAANRAKSEFLANMSHEIRTPLNGVLGVAAILAQSALDERQREMVEIIENSAVALNALLSDILDIARVESGQLTIEPEPFHLARAVREVADLFAFAAEAKGLSLELAIEASVDEMVHGDGVRLRQILTNLISNAVKFTEVGGVRMVVRCDKHGGRDLFEFAVHDTGIGFAEEQKLAIFGRFRQGDGSITRRFGGSGLGLAISRSLAELMGGTLDAVSTPGEGSVFTLHLPLAPVASTGGADDAPASAQAEPTGLSVLIADDHATNRRVAELVLASAGVATASVGNGLEAVEMFRAARFDLVLMDMQMPVMDGLAAIAEIRRLEAESGAPPTPILALTANAMPEHVRATAAAGADGHLAKPFVAAELLAAVADLCERQQAPAPGRTPARFGHEGPAQRPLQQVFA